MAVFTESFLEQTALVWLAAMGLWSDMVFGSTGGCQCANPSEIAKLKVFVPVSNVITKISRFVALLHKKLILNLCQNRCLAGLRDTLLPKLLSEEIELPAAEAVAEGVK